MKTFSLSIIYTLAVFGLLALYQQIQVNDSLINALLQAPMVGGLIYLVLKLEDKRQASAMVREESFRKIVDSLLGVIVELSSLAKPGVISSDDLIGFQEYIKKQIVDRS